MNSNSPGKCMLHLKKHQNIIKCLKKLYDSDLFQEKLTLLLHHVDIIDIKSFLSMQITLTEKKLFMQESLPPNKKRIWKDKLDLLKKNFLNIPSLKILVQDSILKEKDSSPFWNKLCKEKSKKLWLPTMIDLQELDLNLFCSSVNTSIQNLQYSQIKTLKEQKQNLLMNLSQSLPIIHQNSMECENMTYCRKIRFYPTNEQIKYLKQFFGAHRYLYNKTISYIQNKDKSEKLSLSLSIVRPKIMKNNKDLEDSDPEAWLKNIPYDTRQLAIKNALSSVKSSLELLKNKHITHFNHKFKSKKDNKQIFFVDHRALRNLNLFPNLMKENSKLKVKNRYKKYEKYIPTNDLIILKDGQKYFILFTKEKEIKKIDQKYNILSLDPGIKKFQSFYSPDGYSGEFGNQKLKRKVLHIEKRIDKLKSLTNKNKNKIKKKCYKLKNKVKNIILNFHWKISSFLTKNYKTILLPVFKTQDLKNNLNKYNNRLLDIYSHYKFQQKILYQGTKYGCDVRIIDEYYTTKTCGNCGNINNFVGNSDIFWCPCCKIEMHRDYQAARNIYLKNI